MSYNIFANDMLMLLDDDIDVYNYADDNSLACTGNDYTEIQQKLVYNVNKIMTWFQQNNMKVNPDKFDFIVFGKHDGLENIIIGDYSIKPKDNVKILGLHLDNKLKFDEHITKLCQNAGKQVQVISRLRHVLDEETKLLLYNCFVECYFNYCSIVWHFCSKYNTYKLEKLQKKALKCVTLNFTSSYKELLHMCRKHPLYIVRMHKILELVFKINQNMTPKYITDLIEMKNVYFNLRGEYNLNVPNFNTISYGRKSFRYISSFYWNMLPNEFKDFNSMSFSSFKKLLCNWKPKCACGYCIQCTLFNM